MKIYFVPRRSDGKQRKSYVIIDSRYRWFIRATYFMMRRHGVSKLQARFTIYKLITLEGRTANNP